MAFDPSVNYLDFWHIIAYEIIGSPTVAVIIGMVLIAFFAMKNQMPFQLAIIAELTWLLIAASLTFNLVFWAFAVLLIGGISYFLISKTIQRG